MYTKICRIARENFGKMKTVGIICEYNPFHNGHAKQLRRIRERYGENAAIVCLMSGNYVQRGEPALFDKTVRARAAVECGADLVLELPVSYALRSAEGFADGGVELLDGLGVDALCFGCECGDDNLIMSTARELLTPSFAERLHKALERGVSFAAARAEALAQTLPPTALERPNDILAVEYCKALLRRGSGMEVFAIAREGDYHGTAENAKNPSASFLRGQIRRGEAWQSAVPEAAAALYEAAPRYTLAAGERAVLARLRTLPDADFEALPFGSEGLWRRFMRACRTEAGVEAIITATKSKRYARTRIQRMLICAYLGLTETDLQSTAPYVRILAFNETGRSFLNLQRTDRLVNAGAVPPDPEFYALERRASDLYTLFGTDPNRLFCGLEEKNRIFYQDLEKNTCKS